MKMNKKAITLIEIMIIVAVIGLLVSIVFGRHLDKNNPDTLEKVIQRNDYNKADVELFCNEKSINISDFAKSEVLHNRYENWLDDTRNKKRQYGDEIR